VSNAVINTLENWFKTHYSESFIRENFKLIRKEKSIEHKQFDGRVAVNDATFRKIASPWDSLHTVINLHLMIEGVETFISFFVEKIDFENGNLIYILLKNSEDEQLFLIYRLAREAIRKTKFSDEVSCMNLSGMPEDLKHLTIGQAKTTLAKIQDKLTEKGINIIHS